MAQPSLQDSYDRVADEYAERIFNELEHKPLDRALLDRLIAEVGALGPICDLGCGPGQIARYLHTHGASALGVDLSPRMAALAHELTPGVPFQQGDMLALNVADAAWGGIAAFYSIIHIPRERVADALREMRRALRPGGRLLLAFHSGRQVIHRDEWWGQTVSIDFIFFEPGDVQGYLREAGLIVEECIERAPYAGVEADTQRAYIFARRPEE